ncbi:PAS domain S-box protein [Chlamydiales bacterium]|nr:PAS domain S-box protein [Chlamydiales bacterium]
MGIEKRDLLKMALEISHEGLWDWNIKTDDIYFSPRFYEMLGFELGEIPSKFEGVEKLIRDEDRMEIEGALENHFRFQEPFEREVRYKTKEGKWKWILTRGEVVERGQDGTPLRMIGINTDIDEKKRRENELSALHLRLIDAIEILSSGFVLFDKNEKLVVCNSLYKEMYSEVREFLTPGTSYEVILNELFKRKIPESRGIDKEQWMAQKIAHLRNPGKLREERLKERWIEVSEKRTNDGGVVSLLTDITERVDVEETLKRYQDIVQTSHDAIISHDMEGVITSWNPASFDIYGYTPQEALGQHLSLLIPLEIEFEGATILEQLKEGVRIDRYETVRERAGGEFVDVSMTVSPIKDSKGHIIGASQITHDITENKKIENELIHRDKLINGVLNASNYLLKQEDFFIALGLALASVGEMAEVEKVTVQTNREGEGFPFNERYVWSDGVKREKELIEFPEDKLHRLKSGKLIEESINGKFYFTIPMISKTGYLGFVCFENVREFPSWLRRALPLLQAFTAAVEGSFIRKGAEVKIKLSELRFRSVFNSSLDAILALESNGVIRLFNQAAEKMFQIPASKAIGKNISLFFPGEILEDRDIHELTAYRFNKVKFPVEVSTSKTKIGSDELSVAIIRDISERKQAELQLAVAREKENTIGFKIQNALLLGKPPKNLIGIEVAPITIASQGVDGDFYDFYYHSRTEFDLLIGDVMGKGIAAALLGAATKNAFNHALTTLMTPLKGERLPDPYEIVTLVHEQVTQEVIEIESFITICFARFNGIEKTVTYVDCGHPDTLLWRQKEKTLEILHGDNVPLGFLVEEKYQQKTVQFSEGDVFLFYSDGMTDARSPSGEFFGIESLKNSFCSVIHLTAQEIISSIIQDIEEFSETDLLKKYGSLISKIHG